MRFFDEGYNPVLCDDPVAAQHARNLAKEDELTAEVAEAFKLLHEDAANGLLDQPPPEDVTPIEDPGAPLPVKVSSLSVSWASEQPPDATLGHVDALEAFFKTKKAKDILGPLHAAKVDAAKAAKSKGGHAHQRTLLVSVDASIAIVDRPKFENGLRALKTAISMLDDDDKANGDIYLNAVEKVSAHCCHCVTPSHYVC